MPPQKAPVAVTTKKRRAAPRSAAKKYFIACLRWFCLILRSPSLYGTSPVRFVTRHPVAGQGDHHIPLASEQTSDNTALYPLGMQKGVHTRKEPATRLLGCRLRGTSRVLILGKSSLACHSVSCTKTPPPAQKLGRFGEFLCKVSFVRYPPRSAESVFQPLEDCLTRDAQRRADLPQR